MRWLTSIVVFIRRLMGSTDQADPSYFYFRISWILVEWHWFQFFCHLGFLQGLRSKNIKFNENWNFWSKILIFRFWSSQCLRLLKPCRKLRGQKREKQLCPSTILKYWSGSSLDQLDPIRHLVFKTIERYLSTQSFITESFLFSANANQNKI